ncbi:MAG: patatin-like phospholipase family protein [Gammaproteobacteria bacterium]|nr:patatin-like phospholipase family protein [Gammaproteobacteria bacterium]
MIRPVNRHPDQQLPGIQKIALATLTERMQPGHARTGTGYLHMRSVLIAPLLILFITGCTTTARITNTPVDVTKPVDRKAITSGRQGQRSDSALFFISFSGGGTRAAALSYGVLEELRDTSFVFNGEKKRLLDEVDSISSVSGGSFTAAYYALYGDRIFEDYEDVFLRRNVQKTLIGSVLNPINWVKMGFTKMNRTELAIDYYDRNIFRGSTFADIEARDGPYLEINATDLGIGQRFTFTQSSFNMLCSDLGDFSVARAVAASSAVPIAFKPVTLKNYGGCQHEDPPWVGYTRKNTENNERLRTLLEGYDSYQDKETRRYIHLVDGGITDNLGVRSLSDRVEATGGALRAFRDSNTPLPKYIIVIVVNAQTRAAEPMDSSNESPSNATVLGAVSKTQIGRYNLESMVLLEESLERWAAELSTPEHQVTPYFIKLDFESIADEKIRLIFNNMATSFSLPDEEVDNLIEAGHQLLRISPDYQRLIALIKKAEQARNTTAADQQTR